jgi:hypothetical protein
MYAYDAPSNPRTRYAPQNQQPENACAAAEKEPGAIVAAGPSGTLADGLGLAGGAGTFWNAQTGTTGYYVTVGVAGGADVSASFGGSIAKICQHSSGSA